MAEFLHILSEQYDYPQLADEILRELSNKEFNQNDTRGPKSVSSFIIKLSELEPRLIIKQMTLLAKQLDSEAYTLRCAVVEVCGDLIADLSKQEERTENYKTQISAFFDVLEEQECNREKLTDTENIDEVCDYAFAAVEHQYGLFNAGVLVAKPNKEMHKRLLRKCK